MLVLARLAEDAGRAVRVLRPTLRTWPAILGVAMLAHGVGMWSLPGEWVVLGTAFILLGWELNR